MKNPRKIWVCVICARLRHSLLRQLRQSCQQMADRSREKYAPAVRCVHPPYPPGECPRSRARGPLSERNKITQRGAPDSRNSRLAAAA